MQTDTPPDDATSARTGRLLSSGARFIVLAAIACPTDRTPRPFQREESQGGCARGLDVSRRPAPRISSLAVPASLPLQPSVNFTWAKKSAA